MKPTYNEIVSLTREDDSGYYGKTEGEYPDYYSWNYRPCWSTGGVKYKVFVHVPGKQGCMCVATRVNIENVAQAVLDGIVKLENS